MGIYTCVITGFIYPVVVHWVWDGSGWISAFNSATDETKAFSGGCMDFAGSGVVYMTGGLAGLMGAAIIGERTGRFELDNPEIQKKFLPHNAVLCALGTFILWFGWYGFNPGSTLAITPDGYSTAMARVAVTTTLAPAASCIVVLLLKAISSKKKWAGDVGSWRCLQRCAGRAGLHHSWMLCRGAWICHSHWLHRRLCLLLCFMGCVL